MNGRNPETVIGDIGAPEDFAKLGDPGFADGTFRGTVLWENGFQFRNVTVEGVLESALELLEKPGVMVQAALRPPLDAVTGGAAPGRELVVMIRRGHEMDIRTLVRSQEDAERNAGRAMAAA